MEQIFFKATSVAILHVEVYENKNKKKENRTQQNYKFLLLNISLNSFKGISLDKYLKRRQNRKL